MKNINNFENKKNVTVNKRRAKIESRCKSMLYLWKNNLKKKLSKTINYYKVRDRKRKRKKKERNKLEKRLMTDQLKKASLEDIGHFLSIKEKKIIINRKE